ncbi:hypothetical protein [Ornithinimicrobium kibberense]|uniref:hypothetical protein n=1 Tax=Ornithinimicrobium kibberense TaxID=282060 RepID=UPI00360BAFD6
MRLARQGEVEREQRQDGGHGDGPQAGRGDGGDGRRQVGSGGQHREGPLGQIRSIGSRSPSPGPRAAVRDTLGVT